MDKEKKLKETLNKDPKQKKKNRHYIVKTIFSFQIFSSESVSFGHCLKSADYFGAMPFDCKFKSTLTKAGRYSLGLLSAIPGHALPGCLFCGI